MKFCNSLFIVLERNYLLFGEVLRLLGCYVPELLINVTFGLSPIFLKLDFCVTSKCIWLVQKASIEVLETPLSATGPLPPTLLWFFLIEDANLLLLLTDFFYDLNLEWLSLSVNLFPLIWFAWRVYLSILLILIISFLLEFWDIFLFTGGSVA